MKKNVQFLYVLLLISLFSFCGTNKLYAQENVDISAGVGLPELINLGVRFQFPQVQVGLSGGILPAGGENSIAVVGDFFYHFAGKSVFSDRRPWYGRVSLGYLRDDSEVNTVHYWYLGPRIGRDINFSEKFGMGIDLGIMFQLSRREVRKVPPSGWDFQIEIPIMPSGGINFFYRL